MFLRVPERQSRTLRNRVFHFFSLRRLPDDYRTVQFRIREEVVPVPFGDLAQPLLRHAVLLDEQYGVAKERLRNCLLYTSRCV